MFVGLFTFRLHPGNADSVLETHASQCASRWVAEPRCHRSTSADRPALMRIFNRVYPICGLLSGSPQKSAHFVSLTRWSRHGGRLNRPDLYRVWQMSTVGSSRESNTLTAMRVVRGDRLYLDDNKRRAASDGYFIVVARAGQQVILVDTGYDDAEAALRSAPFDGPARPCPLGPDADENYAGYRHPSAL